MNKDRSLKDYAGVAGAGVAMGAADVVPGVSGGTMAFILGIYEELLSTIKSVDVTFIRHLLAFRIKDALEHINIRFILALGTGLAVSILSLARIVTWLYEHQQGHLFSFFFGLILGSILLIASHVRWGAKTALSLVAGALIAFMIVRLVPVQMPSDPFTLFWCGSIAIMAMILPGISGSFILLILGQYKTVMTAVKGFDILTILPFAFGALAGLLLFARILSWLLDRFHQLMISFLTGFMVGSLWKIWPYRDVLETMEGSDGELVPVREAIRLPAAAPTDWLLPLLLCIAGFLAVYALDRIQKRTAPEHTLGG